jgi:Gluconate 2-dehydrogenase subunit 3
VNTRNLVDPLTRREALQRAIALLGGAIIGGPALLAACAKAPSHAKTSAAQGLFDANELALLDDIADTILPATTTPGARAAQVGAFMAVVVTDCYTHEQQAAFKAGIADVEQRAHAQHGHSFREIPVADRLALLVALEREQQSLTQTAALTSARGIGASDEVAPSMRMFRELTLVGYFTSEIGCTQAQRFIAVPGSYEPCVPYHPGDRAWARTA